MTHRSRIVVLTSCTGLKEKSGGRRLELADFARGRDHVSLRERELELPRLRAEDLYRGQHHLRLMRGVKRARGCGAFDVDLRIISGGYGLVGAKDRLAPYECTLQDMSGIDRWKWARTLGVPEQVRDFLQTPYELALVLLGDDYLSACEIEPSMMLGGPTLIFCARRSALRLPPLPRLSIVPVGKAHTKRFSCGLIALKGELGGRLLTWLAEDPSRLSEVTRIDPLHRLASVGPPRPLGALASAKF
jgi:hypothetical protein